MVKFNEIKKRIMEVAEAANVDPKDFLDLNNLENEELVNILKFAEAANTTLDYLVFAK